MTALIMIILISIFWFLVLLFTSPVYKNKDGEKKIEYPIKEYNKNGKLIYYETRNYFSKYEYDEKGNIIFIEYPHKWEKYEYDEKGNIIFHETPVGWEKYIYDEDGTLLSCEKSNDSIIFYR